MTHFYRPPQPMSPTESPDSGRHGCLWTLGVVALAAWTSVAIWIWNLIVIGTVCP